MTSARSSTPGGGSGEPPPHISDTLLWQRVCESFMTGILHAIGSRVSALSGIATMAGMGRELDGTLLSLLEEEVELLVDILQASRGLPRAPKEVTGPCKVAELMPGVLRLLELNLEARGIDIEYHGPDAGGLVELDSTTVIHSLATLLTCLSWRAADTGASKLRLGLRIDETSIEVTGSLEGGSASAADARPIAREHNAPSGELVQRGLDAIRSIAAAHGGRLKVAVDDLPDEFALRLPALGA